MGDLPIFSPTVTTMRFQPIMRAEAERMATAIFTQVANEFRRAARASRL